MRAQHLWSGGYLVGCLLLGNVVGQYRELSPLGEQRGLDPRTVLRETLMRFDATYASVGLAVGIASLLVVWWVARGR